MSDEISDERVEQAVTRLTTTRYLCTKCGWNGGEPRRMGQVLLCAECDYCPVGFEPDPDALVVIDALRAARQRAREAEAERKALRELLAWAVGYVNTSAILKGVKHGGNSASDGTLDWLKRAEAALAAAESAAATGGGT